MAIQNRVFTSEQFQNFIKDGAFSRTQEINLIDTQEREEYNDEGDLKPVNFVYGEAYVIHEKQGVKISYCESWNHDEYMPDTFSASTDGQEEVWTIEGAEILDEDGDLMSVYDFSDLLVEKDFDSVDYDEYTSSIDKTDEVDCEASNGDVKNPVIYTLDNDDAPNVRFNGELIEYVSSKTPQRNDRWTVLSLYKTVGGKYVCHTEGFSCWVGERKRNNVFVASNIEQVLAHFGNGWLAKELYDDAGIDNVVEIC